MEVLEKLTPAQERNVRAARTFFDLLQRMDVEAWSALWHEAARIIVFYPPAGFPGEIAPRAEIVKGFRTLLSIFETFDPEITALYPAADSDAVVVEYRPRATLGRRNGLHQREHRGVPVRGRADPRISRLFRPAAVPGRGRRPAEGVIPAFAGMTGSATPSARGPSPRAPRRCPWTWSASAFALPCSSVSVPWPWCGSLLE